MSDDHDYWKLDYVSVRPPFQAFFRLGRCRRYDLLARMATGIGVPRGVREDDPGTQQLLWHIYDLIAEAHELDRMRPENAGGYIDGALWRCARDDVLIELTGRMGLASDRQLRRRLEPGTRSLIYRLAGQPRKRRGQRRHRDRRRPTGS